MRNENALNKVIAMIISIDADTLKKTPLSDEDRALLEALKHRPVVPDEDCPELTEEQLKKLKRVSDERKHA